MTEKCFNWATRVRAWKYKIWRMARRSKKGFNWATRVRAWKSYSLCPSCSAQTPLQLGHARTRVEIIPSCPYETVLRKASIGPRAYARGNQPVIRPWHAHIIRFNWATRVRAWK